MVRFARHMTSGGGAFWSRAPKRRALPQGHGGGALGGEGGTGPGFRRSGQDIRVCSYVRVCVRSRALAGRALFLAPLSPPQPPGRPTWRDQTVPLGPCQSTPARIGGQGSLMLAPGWPRRLPSGMPWRYLRG